MTEPEDRDRWRAEIAEAKATMSREQFRDWLIYKMNVAGDRPHPTMGRRVAELIDIKAINHRLRERDRTWDKAQAFGEDGWFILGNGKGIIVTLDFESDPGTDWLHASFSYQMRTRIPGYADLKLMHYAVFGEGHAYQCFVPTAEHINITSNVLHLFGRLDGKPVLPDFGRFGTI
jgi:hypothetical protein